MGRVYPSFRQCPARGAGLAHIQDGETHADGRCVYCGCPWDRVQRKWGSGATVPRNVAPELAREYATARKEGLADQDAQALVAHLHGLSPGEDQKYPWTLEELTRLMVMKKTHSLLG